MAKYRKKPVVIEATQWFKYGDHPEVKDVFRPVFKVMTCEHCQKDNTEHGRVAALEGHHIVCPGDWIITGVKGEFYPCKPGVFELTYETVI